MKNIILITDKKAGHENISKGIISEIKKHHNIDVIEVDAKLRFSFFKHILKLLINKSKFWYKKSWFIKLFYKQVNLPIKEKNFHLIISTGGTTSFLNIMLSLYFECPNIYCSSLRGLNNTFFSYIISIVSRSYQNEIVVDIAPLSLNLEYDNIAALKQSYHLLSYKKTWVILIGSSTKEYIFSKDDFNNMLEQIIFLARKNNAELLITTSRRTTIEIEKLLLDIYHENKDVIKKMVLYNIKPEKVMMKYFTLADIIFCTEDSGSMITEAILSKKHIYTIRAYNANPQKVYKIFIEKLILNQYIISIDIDYISNITFQEPIKRIIHMPAEVVYKQIKIFFNTTKG